MADVRHAEAESYLADLNKAVKKIATRCHEVFVALGCTSYVKTIYIGYDIGGVMVAALYGHTEYVEIALALPEQTDSQILVDASHLTWRTLPVAAVLTEEGEVAEFKRLAAIACRGIVSGTHTVNRDNEFFVAAKKNRLSNRKDSK
jgi:hypothetical protein